jgi:23S rRNA (guanine2445-N2)-methyltransferase / 23S rRNA (guanine2069-N7)-methyltransferase
LLELLLPLMSRGGLVFFSTNYRRFKLDEETIARVGASWREISAQTVPPEYRNTRIHRCWRIVAGASQPSMPA